MLPIVSSIFYHFKWLKTAFLLVFQFRMQFQEHWDIENKKWAFHLKDGLLQREVHSLQPSIFIQKQKFQFIFMQSASTRMSEREKKLIANGNKLNEYSLHWSLTLLWKLGGKKLKVWKFFYVLVRMNRLAN